MLKKLGRNYWLLVYEGIMFGGGIIILNTGGIVALFINTMTGSNMLIGLAVTVVSMTSILGQMVGAPFTNSIRDLPVFLSKIYFVNRIIPFFMAIPLFLDMSANQSVIIFMILLGLFFILDGLMVVPWGELYARSIKPEMRIHMFGVMISLAGIFSLIIGLLLTWLLATPILSDNHRFAYLFILSGIFLLLSVIGIRLVKDPNPVSEPEKPDVIQFYKQIPQIIKGSKPLQNAIIARIPSFIGFAATAFLIVFGAGQLELSDAQISWLVYANIIGSIIGGIFLAEISRKYGNKMLILICNIGIIIVLCMAVSLIFTPYLGYIWLFIICILASITLNSWFGYFTYFIEIAPEKDRPLYQLVGLCIGIPFGLTGLIMGIIIDNFGFLPMFLICGVFAVISTLLTLRLLSKNKVTELANRYIEE